MLVPVLLLHSGHAQVRTADRVRLSTCLCLWPYLVI